MWNVFKVNNKVKNKNTVHVVLASLLLTLNTFNFFYSVSIVYFDLLIAGWGCCLLFWRFVPARISLGKIINKLH